MVPLAVDILAREQQGKGTPEGTPFTLETTPVAAAAVRARLARTRQALLPESVGQDWPGMTVQVAAFTPEAALVASGIRPPSLLAVLVVAVMAEATPPQQDQQEQQTLAAAGVAQAGRRAGGRIRLAARAGPVS